MKFKQIEGFPNYLIYEDGGVWSNYGKGRWIKAKIGDGYLKVSLFRDGKQNYFSIHRLLAIHFIPNSENKPCVDHKDGIRTNNKLCNLRWVTNRENDRNRVNAKGVSFYEKDNLWLARWYVNKKQKSKSFKTEEEALKHRKLMVDKYYNRPIIT